MKTLLPGYAAPPDARAVGRHSSGDGSMLAGAPGVVAELYLEDISIPPVIYAKLGMVLGPVFSSGPIL